MKFFKKVVIISIILILIPGIMLSLGKNDINDIIKKTLLNFNGKVRFFDIVDWSVINREFLTISQMEEICDDIIRSYGADKEDFVLTKESDEIYRITTMKGMLDSKTFLQIVIQSVKLPEQYEKKPQTYLTLNVISRDFEKFDRFKTKTRDIINFSGGKSNITTCVVGSFDGKLNKVEQSEILQTFISKLKLNDVNKFEDDMSINLLGYCPYLSEGIDILGKNYNINVETRYDYENDMTYIWIGTPIISTKY